VTTSITTKIKPQEQLNKTTEGDFNKRLDIKCSVHEALLE